MNRWIKWEKLFHQTSTKWLKTKPRVSVLEDKVEEQAPLKSSTVFFLLKRNP